MTLDASEYLELVVFIHAGNYKQIRYSQHPPLVGTL
jgi:hypothetical protein